MDHAKPEKRALEPAGRYRKVQVRTWSDEKFRALSPIPPCGQGLWLFLVTGPHTGPIPGLFRAGRASMAEELDWDQEAFDKAFQEAFREGMVKADFKARLVWLPNAIKHNRPESPNVVKSWAAEFDLLPECDLKREAFEALKASVHALGEAFGKAFDEAFGKPSAKPLPKAMANQEQEQEKEPPTPRKRGRGSVVEFPPGFAEFWFAYPRKTAKQDAAKAFAKLGAVSPDLLAAILAAVRRQAASDQWRKDSGAYVPHAATWLNGMRWEDEAPSDASSRMADDIFAGAL